MEAIGEGVQGFCPGDVVSTIPAFSQKDYGVYGELALVPATAVVKHPALFSREQAAALWMQFATAYGALIDIAQVKAGDVVLIPAASSSVGLAAIQIANLVGAMPIGLTRTNAKRRQLIEAGAVHVIATEEQDLVAEVKETNRRQRCAGRVRSGRGTNLRQIDCGHRRTWNSISIWSAQSRVDAVANH